VRSIPQNLNSRWYQPPTLLLTDSSSFCRISDTRFTSSFFFLSQVIRRHTPAKFSSIDTISIPVTRRPNEAVGSQQKKSPPLAIESTSERASTGPINKYLRVFQSCSEAPSSWCSSRCSSFRHSDSSLYPDSLNQETSSVTGSTRVEFMIGSPTRRFRTSTTWPHRYFDSIDSAATVPESLLTDEFPLRRGEALAECDSLECHPISSED